MAKTADRCYRLDPWRIIEEGFDPARGRVSESVFSLANEYMGVRGYFEEGYGGDRLVTPKMGFQCIALKPLNFNGSVEVRMGLDFSLEPESAGANFWSCPKKGVEDGIAGIVGRTQRRRGSRFPAIGLGDGGQGARRCHPYFTSSHL
ncbi:MAG: hypothetical protein AB1700_21135 [Bacillota bacterium]